MYEYAGTPNDASDQIQTQKIVLFAEVSTSLSQFGRKALMVNDIVFFKERKVRAVVVTKLRQSGAFVIQTLSSPAQKFHVRRSEIYRLPEKSQKRLKVDLSLQDAQ